MRGLWLFFVLCACGYDAGAIAPGSGADAEPLGDSGRPDASMDSAPFDARRDGRAPDSAVRDSSTDTTPMDSAMDSSPPDTTPPDTSRPDALRDCPTGYSRALTGSTSCYRIVSTARTWQAAERNCESAGAHLIVIDDAAEDAFVPDYHWIGYSETVTDGVFLWVTGAGASSYEGWASGEPRTGGAACAVQRPDGWHDDNDYEPKSSVCEHDGVMADGSTWE